MLFGYKVVDECSNWNYYCVGSKKFAKKVDDKRILEVIGKCLKLLRKPF